MWAYFLRLALRSLKHNPVLTALMVLAIGLGIGASMTMLTILHVMSADPIPDRSAQLFYPQIDPQSLKNYRPGDEPPNQFTWIDAQNLLHARKAIHQVAMTGGGVIVRPQQRKQRPFLAVARYTSADFFDMFEIPFAYGGGWTSRDDTQRARLAVISRGLADKLYGADHAVGQTLRLGDSDFRVIGVIDHWNPIPHYYDLTQGSYTSTEQVFMPLTTAIALKEQTFGDVNCWSRMPADGDLTNADCTWLQFWVQLDTPQQAADYRAFLVNYSQEQKNLGRFERAPNVRLRSVMQWLNYNHVIPGSVQLQSLLALGFMLVCLLNTVTLLLVKFLKRGHELSVRRAMGASQKAVFLQLLVEASLIGLSGGIIGMLLAWCGLWIVRQQPVSYADLAHLDWAMLLASFGLAIGTTLLAAAFPAWRACRIMPARLLKIQ